MPYLSEPFMSVTVDLGIDPSTMLGSTTIPYHSDRFGSNYIAPSTPFVGGSAYPLPRPNASICLYRRGPRHVNIGSTTYIPSYAPSFTSPIFLNVFFMMHPPHISHSSSGWSATSSHVVASFTNTFVSRGYGPPYVFRVQPLYQYYNYG